MRSRSGFTLAEALLVGVLLTLILSSVARLAHETNQLSAFSSKKDRMLAGGQTAVATVSGDLAAAVGSVTISAGNPKLRLQRVDPGQAGRVGPIGLPTNWDPWDPTNMCQVEYHLVNEMLFRQVTLPGQSATNQELASGVQGFQCTSLPNGRYQVSITFIEEMKASTVSSFVIRRVGQEPPL